MTAQSSFVDPYRLDRNVIPRHYAITLEPDLAGATFVGTVEIALEITSETALITCNAIEIEIDEATVTSSDGRSLSLSATLDTDLERVTFASSETMQAGPATLTIGYRGILNDQLRGFYRSSFKDPHGVEHLLATTQMAPTDARRAFPCWDEPDRKATFALTLIVDEGLSAYANGAVESSAKRSDNKRAITFAPSMIMSSYLVAATVGPFDETEPVDVDGTLVKVVAPVGKGDLCDLALEVGAFSLRFFADYFAIAYPGDKLDLIAVPDFAYGAMENMGCVLFRETALLVDQSTASRGELDRVIDVVAHEIAHMWFGNLVTMGWWEGIWLNEAFATFMATLCADAYRPAAGRWISFGLDKETALRSDGLHSTRPIEFVVHSPDDATAMFDVLTYEKGGSVLRMLEQYLGAETFRDGIRIYLKRHAYSNTVTKDLWDALEIASGKPVADIMDTWILQGGHPLVTIDDHTVRQEPFTYGPPTGGSAIGENWNIPLGLRSLGGERATILLGADPVAIPLERGPVIANADGSGVFRVAYAPEHLLALGESFEQLTALERACLINDARALTIAGSLDLRDFLSLASSVSSDSEPTTFEAILSILGLLSRIVGDDQRSEFSSLVRRLLDPMATSLSWERADGEGDRVSDLRAALLVAMGTLANADEVVTEARRRFDVEELPSGDLEPAIYELIAAHPRPGDYERMLERFRSAPTAQRQLAALYGLGGFSSADDIEATFSLAFSEVRAQNGPSLLAHLVANKRGGPLAWNLMTEHWDALLDRFPPLTQTRMLSGIPMLFADANLAADVIVFLESHPIPAGELTVRQLREWLTINAAFAERTAPTLRSVLLA